MELAIAPTQPALHIRPWQGGRWIGKMIFPPPLKFTHSGFVNGLRLSISGNAVPKITNELKALGGIKLLEFLQQGCRHGENYGIIHRI